jgi:translation initiation factor 1
MRLFAGTQFDRPPKCERCNALESECACPRGPLSAKNGDRQIVRLSVEKRRKGKVVTVVQGIGSNDLVGLLSQLKTVCGAGGTLKDGLLEIQGDHVDRISGLLKSLGYCVKS